MIITCEIIEISHTAKFGITVIIGAGISVVADQGVRTGRTEGATAGIPHCAEVIVVTRAGVGFIGTAHHR